MEYMSTSEIAKEWGITRRRVTKLCSEGRIEGAIFKANTWLVPSDVKKPKDQRKEKERKGTVFNEKL